MHNAKPIGIGHSELAKTLEDPVHWRLSVNSDSDENEAAKCLHSAFAEFAELFHLPTIPTLNEDSLWPNILISTPEGFEIQVGSNRTNSFSLQQKVAVGSISYQHGVLPLIALWYVGQKLDSSNLGSVSLTTLDSVNACSLRNFSDLKSWFHHFGESYEEWASIARDKELLPTLISSAEILSDEDGFYF